MRLVVEDNGYKVNIAQASEQSIKYLLRDLKQSGALKNFKGKVFIVDDKKGTAVHC